MAGASNQDIPISGQVTNPCNGETVTLSGIVHLTFNLTVEGGGGFHLAERDNIHVTATGSLGNSYEGNEEDMFSLNGRFGVEQTVGTTFSEISLGSAPNFEQPFSPTHNRERQWDSDRVLYQLRLIVAVDGPRMA